MEQKCTFYKYVYFRYYHINKYKQLIKESSSVLPKERMEKTKYLKENKVIIMPL